MSQLDNGCVKNEYTASTDMTSNPLPMRAIAIAEQAAVTPEGTSCPSGIKTQPTM